MRFTFDPPENWNLNAGAFVEENPSAPTQPNALRMSLASDPSAWHVLSGLTVGQQYQVFVRCNFDAVESLQPFVRIQYADQPAYFNALLFKDPDVTGWELRDCGLLTYGEPGVIDGLLRLVGVSNFNPGQVYIDTIYIGENPFEDEGEMSKRREIRTALLNRVATVTVANGFALTLGEVKLGPRRFPDDVGAWPSVAVMHGEESKELRTMTALGTKSAVLSFSIGVGCRRTESTEPDDQCDDTCAEIEKALETHADGVWTGFPPYVDNVFVSSIDPEELSEEVGKGDAVWFMTALVTYHHNRRSP